MTHKKYLAIFFQQSLTYSVPIINIIQLDNNKLRLYPGRTGIQVKLPPCQIDT